MLQMVLFIIHPAIVLSYSYHVHCYKQVDYT